MTGFAYSTDVGTASYNNIVSFARRSGIAFSVTSTTTGDHAEKSYHYSGNAVDLASSAGQMQALAEWLIGYAPYELELIHSGGKGYFVKDGKIVPASFYGATTVSQHYNHVHIAMTNSGITAALSGGSVAPTNATDVSQPISTGPRGCLGTVTTAVASIGGIAWMAFELAHILSP